MSAQQRTVLVTGGAGYVGSHACKALAAAGYLPVTLDDLSRGHREFVRWGPLVEGCISDREVVSRTIAEFNPTAVLHFAAFAYVGESMQAPELYYENNVRKSIALLETLRACDLRRIVFSSTCAVYGNLPTGVCNEKDTPRPISTYGRTKFFIEQVLEDYCRAHQFSVSCLRYFNAAGADPDGEIGESHDPEPHIIPTILAAARDGVPVRVFGSDYPTKDGTCVRDFTHVSDLARAHVLALQKKSGPPFNVFNLGTGQGYSLLEVVDVVSKVTNRAVEVELCERRPGDPAVAVANPSTAFQAFAWSPDFPNLETIINHAWTWSCRPAASPR